MRPAGLGPALAVALGGAAFAQVPAPSDAIGDLLQEPSAPPVAGAPRPPVTTPVFLDQLGRSPEAPPSLTDLAYDSRLKASSASAQGFQGPLDGGWTMAADGADLFVLQLVDRAGALEGSWRDLRRPGALDASGFIAEAERLGEEVTFRWEGRAVALRAGPQGQWVGEFLEEGRRRPVSLRRRGP